MSVFSNLGSAAAATVTAPSLYDRLLDLPDDLLDVLPTAICMCDAAGLLLRYNRRAIELWGRRPKLGDSNQRFCGAWRLYRVDGGPLPRAQAPMSDVLRSGRAVRDEVVVERPDGSRITVVVDIIALRNMAGAIVGAVNCFQEIVNQKQADETLRERERRSRNLLEALPAAIYTTDAAGRITFYNKAAADLWGCRPELGDDKWCGSWRLYWPDGRPMPHDECPMAVALKENRPVRGAEAVAERPDGTRACFLPFPTPLYDSRGALVGAVNMLVDITDRKAAEAALRDNETRLRLLAREVDHRAKNLLATVQAITRMTRADTVPDFVDVLMGRFRALSRAHVLLAESHWAGADLRRLIEDELTAFGSGDGTRRVRISGPGLTLRAEAAQGLAMTIHELATNAAKYGALSAPRGRVTTEWFWASDGRLVLRWTEADGPLVRVPSSRGFGTGLINATIEGQLGGDVRFDWREEGLACEISLPADRIERT